MSIEYSPRVAVLVENDAISKVAADTGYRFIELVNNDYNIDNKHPNYDMFETHLVMALDRMVKNEALAEFNEALECEIQGQWFTDYTLEVLEKLCKQEGITFSEVEGKFLAIHIGVLAEKK